MFRDATILDAEGTLDVEVLERYIVDHLGGVIGDQYAAPQGRITVTEGYANDVQDLISVQEAGFARVSDIKELLRIAFKSDSCAA